MSLRVHVIPNRTSPPSVLVRETWREGKRIRRRTVANLSRLPRFLIDAIDAMLQGGVVFTRLQDAVTIRRAWPHGHAAAVLGVCRKLGMRRILHRSLGALLNLGPVDGNEMLALLDWISALKTSDVRKLLKRAPDGGEAPLRATERRLEGIAESVRRGRPGLRGRDRINRRLGRDLDRFKVGKHFDVEVADDGIAWRRNEGRVAARMDRDMNEFG